MPFPQFANEDDYLPSVDRIIAGARKVVIPGAAHIIPLEQPAAFTQAVLDFLLPLRNA